MPVTALVIPSFLKECGSAEMDNGHVRIQMTHKRWDLFHLKCPVLHVYVRQWTIPGVDPLFRALSCAAAGLGPCELLCCEAIFTPDIMLTLLTARWSPPT